MKFTAEFDSVNSADLAAAALKKYISSFSDINICDNANCKNNTIDNSIIIFRSPLKTIVPQMRSQIFR